MHALELRDVDEARRVTADHGAGRRHARRERPEPALGNRLGAPGDALASLEDPAHQRVRLQLLQEVVHGQGRVRRVEPRDEAERDVLGAHRVDEGSAELVVALAGAQRPAERVDDAVERARDAPHLLDPERVDLRVVALEPEAVDRRGRQEALHAICQHRRPGVELGTGLEARARRPVARAPLVARANAADGPVGHEQRLRVGLGQQHHAELLGLLGERARRAARARRRGCPCCGTGGGVGRRTARVLPVRKCTASRRTSP